MAILVSPGVNVSEYDNTTVVPAVSTSVAAIAGVFNWGPGYERTLVDSENTLVQKFGKPTSNNYETFFTAANFLAYGNALYVVRAYGNTALNAIANTSTASAIQIDNYTQFKSNVSIDSNVAFYAKYPGALGNSLKVSVCDSVNAYSCNLIVSGNATVNSGATITFGVGSNTASIVGLSNTSGQANVSANLVAAGLTVGDYIKAGNSTIGYQYLRVTAITTNTSVETAAVVNGYAYSTNGATISFAERYSLSTNLTMASNSTVRYWEYYNTAFNAPGTSQYVSDLGLTTKDELHVIVVDTSGKFAGSPNQVLEVWRGLSRATDARAPQGGSNYYRDVIDSQSKYIFVGTANNNANTGLANAISNSTNVKPITLSFSQGADSTAESTIDVGPIALGFDLFKSKTDVDISLLLQGKAIGNGAIGNYIISNIVENRKDCVAFISPGANVINNADPAQYCVDFRTSSANVSGLTYNSSYAVMDTGYKYQYDKYNDTYRWVPLNGDVAGLCAATDFSRDPWYSPAGFNRGQIKNVVKLNFNPTQAERDLLYKNDINPVVIFPGQGTVLYGDKTLLGRPSAFDRINVRRLFIVLEKAISKAAQSSLFEFNDTFTRNNFVNLVEPYLRTVQGRRGIYDFKVVCDETNNTQQIIDSNQFVGDIYIQPARSINFIQLNFVAVRTGVDFNTIVGQF